MEQRVKERQILQDVLDTGLSFKFTDDIDKLAVIDAFLQFSQNPTSATAGYGVEQNYSFISQNLSKRYNLGKTRAETIVTFIRDSFEKMRQVNYDVYFWRDAIRDYIREKYIEEFLQWYNSLYKNLNEVEKPKFLFLLYGMPKITSTNELHKWFMCFFDKEEKTSEAELKDLAIKLGLGNILYYRSTGGYEESEFVRYPFLDQLGKRFEKETLVEDDRIKGFFESLTLDNMKLLEKCLKETVPVLECRLGRVTQTATFILETSKSYFAASPFSMGRLGELIKSRKLELTKVWKEKFDNVLNSFVKEVYPFAELRHVFDLEGAHCWDIKYTDSPEREPINVVILLSPYVFQVSRYHNILDEMKSKTTSILNLIFLIEETLPTVTEGFRYVSQKNLIFLFNEREKKFYAIERSTKLPEDKILLIDSFLSRFLPSLEKELQISRTWPKDLGEYIENLKYFNRFQRLTTLRNRMLRMEPKLRNTIRVKLQSKFGEQWQEKVREKLPEKVKKLEQVTKERPDKEEIKDFLDGATLGELTEIMRTFLDDLDIDKNATNFLNIITQNRKALEHPLKNIENDIDEKSYKTIKIALDYIDEVICIE
jgi:hypothetical protein